VDANLIALAKKAREISPIPFEITEGLRTKERQRYLVKTGKSRTLKSYHLRGKAIDFVAMPGGKVSWDLKDYKTIVEKAFKPAAKALGLTDKITYGVYWKSIVDGPHVEIHD
jgi:peptidoglycan L-alanyl-D-glutamate endopeptidase CwlK